MPHPPLAALLSCALILATAGTGCRYAPPEDGIVHNPGQGPYYNLGITNQPASLRVPIPPRKGKSYLVIENPHINRLEVRFQHRPDSILTGDYLPFPNRPLPHRLFVIPIDGTSLSDTARITLSKSGENLSFRLRLLDADNWQTFQIWDNHLSGIVFGYYIFLFLFTIFVVMIVQTRKAGLFLAFVLFTSAWIINDAGIFYQYLWPGNPEFHNRSRGFLSSLNMIAFGLYIYQDIHDRMRGGLRWVIYVLIGYVGIKVALLLVVRAMEMPDNFKQYMLSFNALAYAGLFGWVVAHIVFRLREYRETVFEALALLTISLYTFLLSLREHGLAPAPLRWMNGYDVFLFHVVQAMFVGLHVFMLERGKHARRTQEMLDFKVEQERQLGERMLQAEEAEKKRIAQDIHDEIGSIFVSLKYMVLSLCGKFQNPAFSEGLEPIRDLADAGIRKQYAIIDDLLLQPEAEKSLHALLLDKARIISEGTALQVEFRFEADESSLGEFRKLQIHRILSELIANTLKHAQAGHIKIHIRSEDGIRIRYADDGVGIHNRTEGKGMGLTNIHHRLEFMRGTMDVDSGTHGTIFDIRIPYDHE